MKTYTYNHFEFYATSAIHANTGRPLYEIPGLKPAGTRPFLTSISQCKEFISEAVTNGYWIDGTMTHHTTPKR